MNVNKAKLVSSKAPGVLQCSPKQQRDLIKEPSELFQNYIQGIS